MRLFRTLALGASLLVLFGACSTGGGSTGKPAIKIGSDGFDEARVVAEALRRSSRPTATRSIEPASDSARDVPTRRSRAARSTSSRSISAAVSPSSLQERRPPVRTPTSSYSQAWAARAAG